MIHHWCGYQGTPAPNSMHITAERAHFSHINRRPLKTGSTICYLHRHTDGNTHTLACAILLSSPPLRSLPGIDIFQADDIYVAIRKTCLKRPSFSLKKILQGIVHLNPNIIQHWYDQQGATTLNNTYIMSPPVE